MPSGQSILGKFSAGGNILRTSNPALHYEMTESKEGYFETAVGELSPFQKVTRTERIDIVVGSGRKGQTYLFWRNNDFLNCQSAIGQNWIAGSSARDITTTPPISIEVWSHVVSNAMLAASKRSRNLTIRMIRVVWSWG
jgi:hypothetical protein